MAVVEATRPSKANVVEGFSARFNLLMDRAEVPSRNRVTVGSRRFDVVHNTFKNWCVRDKIPGQHSVLLDIVEQLLQDVPGRQNPKAVAAWLLAGDAVPNPFDDDTDALQLVELYFQIADVAKSEGIDFDALPRDARNFILRRIHAHLCGDAKCKKLELDDATVKLAIAMLETAQCLA